LSFYFRKKQARKLKLIKKFATAVGISLNFGHRSRSRRSEIFGYGRRPSAFGPTLADLHLKLADLQSIKGASLNKG
jgi:hypothetical protein